MKREVCSTLLLVNVFKFYDFDSNSKDNFSVWNKVWKKEWIYLWEQGAICSLDRCQKTGILPILSFCITLKILWPYRSFLLFLVVYRNISHGGRSVKRNKKTGLYPRNIQNVNTGMAVICSLIMSSIFNLGRGCRSLTFEFIPCSFFFSICLNSQWLF